VTARARPANEAILERLRPGFAKDLRHKLVRAFAGFAAKNDVALVRCRRVVERLVQETGDEEKNDRLWAVEDSYERVADGLAVTGYRELVEVLGEGGARELAELFGGRWRACAADAEDDDVTAPCGERLRHRGGTAARAPRALPRSKSADRISDGD
jgi:hypothetical protein